MSEHPIAPYPQDMTWKQIMSTPDGPDYFLQVFDLLSELQTKQIVDFLDLIASNRQSHISLLVTLADFGDLLAKIFHEQKNGWFEDHGESVEPVYRSFPRYCPAELLAKVTPEELTRLPMKKVEAA